MATCELTQPLLHCEDDFEEKFFENYATHEDSSSGYESTDSETDVPNSSHEYQIPTKRQNNDHVSERVKSTHALCESLKLIMEVPEMCDVTFLVGPREIPVHGVRAILGTRSKVLYQLIIKHLNLRETGQKYKPTVRHYGDQLTIPVRKYDVEVFRMLIQFVHSGTATITDRTVFGLLCGSDQFELRDLEQACWEYIGRRIENHCGDILSSASVYQHHKNAKLQGLGFRYFDSLYNGKTTANDQCQLKKFLSLKLSTT